MVVAPAHPDTWCGKIRANFSATSPSRLQKPSHETTAVSTRHLCRLDTHPIEARRKAASTGSTLTGRRCQTATILSARIRVSTRHIPYRSRFAPETRKCLVYPTPLVSLTVRRLDAPHLEARRKSPSKRSAHTGRQAMRDNNPSHPRRCVESTHSLSKPLVPAPRLSSNVRHPQGVSTRHTTKTEQEKKKPAEAGSKLNPSSNTQFSRASH